MGVHQAKGSDPFGNLIQRCPKLGVLLHEHQVQRVEYRPSDIPVEAMGFPVQHIGIRQKPAESICDGAALLLREADVDVDGVVGMRGVLV